MREDTQANGGSMAAKKADGLENWKLSLFARYANKLAAMIEEAVKEKETL
jgi:hypothetical protein